MYAEKFKVKEEKLIQKLWGSNFYNTETHKWSTSAGEGCERGFNKFVMEPLMKVILKAVIIKDFYAFLSITIYSQISMARTPLVPWKIV